jgi:hypothetical protein
MKRQPLEGRDVQRTGFRPIAAELQIKEGNHDKQQRRQENTEQKNTLLNDLTKLFA